MMRGWDVRLIGRDKGPLPSILTDVERKIGMTQNDTAARQYGVVRFYDPKKAFGFIGLDDGSGDVYLGGHAVEGLPRVPTADDRLSFCIVEDRKGRLRAADVAFG